MTYGTVATGFARKPLSVILAELEELNIGIFGPSVIQTAQSPLGQWNGLRADAITQAWEIAEEVYQARDPDQAEGVNLEILASLRLIARMVGEDDASMRRAITNIGVANTRDADFARAISNVDGVTWSKIYSNDEGVTDANGIGAHSVSVAAIGGLDEDVAMVARRYIVPGISSYGNRIVSTEIDGFCRSISLLRPTSVPIKLAVTVTKSNDANSCPPPSNAAIAQVLHAGLAGANRPANGQDITLHMVRTIISCVYPNVEVTAATGAIVGSTLAALPIAIAFTEISTIDLDQITITAV